VSAQHTPGPWATAEWNCHAATTIKAGDIVVAECSGFGRYADESIAAAPDLLAAAIEAHAFHKAEGDRAEHEGNRPAAFKLHRFLAGKLSAAIAKAEVQS
jgi:hypothetical protein